LSFGQDNKTSFLECHGWRNDTTRSMEPFDERNQNSNLGFISRASWWREDQVQSGPWRAGVNFSNYF